MHIYVLVLTNDSYLIQKMSFTYIYLNSKTARCMDVAGLSLKKTPHVWLLHAKTTFYCCGV